MKKKNFTQRSIPFLTGTIFGGLVLGFFLLITGSRPPEPQSPANAIDLATAKSYYQKYMSAPIQVGALKGIAVDLDQLSAMNSIRAQNTGVKGFRIYWGLDNASNKVGLAVGIDNLGHDVTTNIIQTTRSYDPCPPICDAPSQIFQF